MFDILDLEVETMLSESRSYIRSGGDIKIVKYKIVIKIGRSYSINFIRSRGNNKIVKYKIVTKIVRFY